MKVCRTKLGLWVGLLTGAVFLLGATVVQAGYPLGWGLNGDHQASPVPTNIMLGADAISGGGLHSLALKDGRVWAWGNNTNGQINVPFGAQSDVDAIAAGGHFSLALKTNGSVLAWGAGTVATNIPAAATSGVSQIAAGDWHALALKDGGVLAWGSNTYNQCTVPDELTNGVSAISAGGYYSMALKDGAVHVFGIAATNSKALGIRDVPPEASNDVTAISAGKWHALALKDGGVIAWGACYDGTNSYADATNVPPEATNGVLEISAGDIFSMALKDDGTIVLWGDDMMGQYPVPSYAATGITAIAAGNSHCLAFCPVMPPRFTGEVLPFGYVSNAYAGSVTATADPAAKYYKTGFFPSWITLDEDTGAIGGLPPEVKSYGFNIVASNIYGTATNSYTLTVFATPPQPPVLVTTSPLSNGTVGVFYSLQIVASNNPYFTWQDAGSGLPPGLTLSTNGLISGTPTNTYNAFFTVWATNIGGSVSSNYNLTISQPTEIPVFVTESPLPSGVVGQAYSTQIVASNGPAFSLFAGSLPNGLYLTAAGMVTGTPTQIENPEFTVRATNFVGSSNRTYTLEVFGPPVFVTESPLPDGVLGEAYSEQIEAIGDALFSLASGSLPSGVSLSTNGLVSGTPTATGPFNFTVKATNDYGWSNRVYDLTIGAIPEWVTTSPLPDGTSGVPYSVQFEATDADAYSLANGSLPSGLDLSVEGLLSGTPTSAGAFNFTVKATNDYGWSNRVFDLFIDGLEEPMFTSVRATNTDVYLVWSNGNEGVDVVIWRTTNLTTEPVPWTSLGIQVSPWTNTGAPSPSYYQLRMAP